MSNYATKDDLKDAASVDTSNLVTKSDLATLKEEEGKIDVDKLKIVPVDLSKLSNVAKKYVVKKLCIIKKLATKVNAIDTGRFVSKTQYNADKLDLEKKICHTSRLGKK